jgi:Arc/MetJ-type ribon-helix-helix transcriptional regulator
MDRTKKRRLSVYLDERQVKFIAADKELSKRSASSIVRYALNALQAQYAFDNREYQE